MFEPHNAKEGILMLIKKMLKRRWFVYKKSKVYNFKTEIQWNTRSAHGSVVLPEDKDEKPTIRVNLYNDNFYEILAHELGHVIHDRNHSYDKAVVEAYEETGVKLDPKFNRKQAWKIVMLQNEILASKHAIRLLKDWGLFNTKSIPRLLRWYKTYLKGYRLRHFGVDLDVEFCLNKAGEIFMKEEKEYDGRENKTAHTLWA